MKTAQERAWEALERFESIIQKDSPDFDIRFPATLMLSVKQSIEEYSNDLMNEWFPDNPKTDVNEP